MMEFKNFISRSGKSLNLILSHGKSWKIIVLCLLNSVIS